jgi:ABC-type cobalt transport system substrate-binding protein
MKTHTRNLIIASLVYLAVFIGLVVISLVSDIGISFFLDDDMLNPDTMIFIASVFFTCLASFAAYFVFYLIQRNKAKNDPNARFLGFFPRIVGAFIASALSCGVGIFCLFWTSDYGDVISILYANTSLLAAIIVVVAVANFVNFIVFKPRV